MFGDRQHAVGGFGNSWRVRRQDLRRNQTATALFAPRTPGIWLYLASCKHFRAESLFVRAAALRWVRVLGGLGMTTLCLWVLLRRGQIGAISAAVQNLHWSWLIAACAALTASYIARIHRGWWILRLCNPETRWRTCVWPLLCGFAVNNVVPSRAGDALRVVGFRDTLQMPPMAVLGSLVLERLLDATILLVFLIVGVVDLTGTGVSVIYLHMSILIASVSALTWIVLLAIGRQAEVVLLRLCRGRLLGKSRISAIVERPIQQLVLALRIVRLPSVARRLLLASAAVWICEGGAFSLRAFPPALTLPVGSSGLGSPSRQGLWLP